MQVMCWADEPMHRVITCAYADTRRHMPKAKFQQGGSSSFSRLHGQWRRLKRGPAGRLRRRRRLVENAILVGGLERDVIIYSRAPPSVASHSVTGMEDVLPAPRRGMCSLPPSPPGEQQNQPSSFDLLRAKQVPSHLPCLAHCVTVVAARESIGLGQRNQMCPNRSLSAEFSKKTLWNYCERFNFYTQEQER
jgi:hypothetical protein